MAPDQSSPSSERSESGGRPAGARSESSTNVSPSSDASSTRTQAVRSSTCVCTPVGYCSVRLSWRATWKRMSPMPRRATSMGAPVAGFGAAAPGVAGAAGPGDVPGVGVEEQAATTQAPSSSQPRRTVSAGP
jgi:hypothetical protein